jgi:hypothetical protein
MAIISVSRSVTPEEIAAGLDRRNEPQTMLTTEQAIDKLKTEAKRRGLRALARALEYDAGHLCHVIAGRKDPEFVLRRFGYERVIHYRKIKKS